MKLLFDETVMQWLLDSRKELAAISSGRTTFWLHYMEDLGSGYFSYGQIIHGNGPASTPAYNAAYSIEVWMHNDFLDLLFCLGVVGLLLYLLAMVLVSIRLKLPFFLFFALAAMLNGFFLYCSVQIMLIFWLVAGEDAANDKA